MTLRVGTGKQVFTDWSLVEPGYGVRWRGDTPASWEMPYGVKVAVHPPRIDPRPLVQAEHPWEGHINVYCTLLQDGRRYRLYYECCGEGERDAPRDLHAMLAYAESVDGATWTKPKVGTVTFGGSKDNNLVYGRELSLGRGAHGATVFVDPTAPAAVRYKLVHMGRERGELCVFGAVSPDGLRWTALEEPLLRGYMSDTQTVMAFDPAKGCYVGYFRGWRGLERGKWHGRRTIAYAESQCFETWPTPRTIVEADVLDNPDADIYTNSFTAWPGAESAYLMFPAYYQRAADTTELHLMTSRDGIRWQRPSREPIIPRSDLGRSWAGGVYAGCGLVTLPSGDWALPIGPVWHTHNQGHHAAGRRASPPNWGYLCLAVWRPDGFTSREAETQGQFTTAPFVYDGGALRINGRTRFGGEIRAELADAMGPDGAAGSPFVGRAFEDCDPFTGDAANHLVTWRGQHDISVFAGKPVRLRFRMRRACLHAFQFVA